MACSCGKDGGDEPSSKPDTNPDQPIEEEIDKSTDGMLTDAEVASYKNMLLTNSDYAVPAKPMYDNTWVFRKLGDAVVASTRVFETNYDITFLNRVIEYCDAALYYRNCQPGGDHRVVGWLGTVEDVWTSTKEEDPELNAAVEQGAVLAHFAHCARLILEIPALWDKEIPSGDPHGYGATYKERAMKYISMCDDMYDTWLTRFINPSDKVFYRRDSLNLIEPIAWNQALMGCDCLNYLAQCHELLGETDRAKLYDDIVAGNVDYFIKDTWYKQASNGKRCLQWRYHKNAAPGTDKYAEDLNHAALDAKVFYNLFYTGRQPQVDSTFMTEFCNTIFDIVFVSRDAQGRFPGRINGKYEGKYNDKYVRHNYIPLTTFRRDAYDRIFAINGDRMTNDLLMLGNSFWAKARRQDAPKNISVSVSGNDVTLKWTPVESGRVVIRSSRDMENWKNVGFAYASKGTYTDKDLAFAGDVFYQLVYLEDEKAGYSTLITANVK